MSISPSTPPPPKNALERYNELYPHSYLEMSLMRHVEELKDCAFILYKGECTPIHKEQLKTKLKTLSIQHKTILKFVNAHNHRNPNQVTLFICEDTTYACMIITPNDTHIGITPDMIKAYQKFWNESSPSERGTFSYIVVS